MAGEEDPRTPRRALCDRGAQHTRHPSAIQSITRCLQPLDTHHRAPHCDARGGARRRLSQALAFNRVGRNRGEQQLSLNARTGSMEPAAPAGLADVEINKRVLGPFRARSAA